MHNLLVVAVVVFAILPLRPVRAQDVVDPADRACRAVEALGCGTYYRDADRDGFGDPRTEHRTPLRPEGEVTVGGDCDDRDPEAYPGAVESFDGRDQDCDGAIDEVVLVVSELMINPRAVPDFDGEWIEVVNASAEPVSLAGVSIGVGDRSCGLPAYSTLGAGGRLVAARSLDIAVNGGVPADVACTAALTNTGAVVQLRAAPGVLDAVDYRGWAVPEGASLSLDPGLTGTATNDVQTAWCPATSALPSGDRGTPRAVNDVCA